MVRIWSPAPAWGKPPWKIDFRSEATALPAEVDLAIVGGGFTGLAVACAMRERARDWSVAVLEAGRLGSGASGRTGGVVLDETAFGPLPGLGHVLGGFTRILEEWQIDCDLELRGCWEISRRGGQLASPIAWNDSGTLSLKNRVAGGVLDPGKLVVGLARAACRLGSTLHERTPVNDVRFGKPLQLDLPDGTLRARHVVFATEAYAHAFTGTAAHARCYFTLALATAPLADEQLGALGLADHMPFYTLDLPYLWGRVCGNNQVIFGGGLVEGETPAELVALDIGRGEVAQQLNSLQARVQALHPALGDVRITHRWGGPICFPHARRPIFMTHHSSSAALVIGGYAGHGIALSIYLSRWVADALLKRRPLPAWGRH